MLEVPQNVFSHGRYNEGTVNESRKHSGGREIMESRRVYMAYPNRRQIVF